MTLKFIMKGTLLIRKQVIQRGGIGGEAKGSSSAESSHSQFLAMCAMLETICFRLPTHITTKQHVAHCTSQVCR